MYFVITPFASVGGSHDINKEWVAVGNTFISSGGPGAKIVNRYNSIFMIKIEFLFFVIGETSSCKNFQIFKSNSSFS